MVNLEINNRTVHFPSTRYQGSKLSLIPVLYPIFKDLECDNVLDIFGGTGVVSLLFKALDKNISYNDNLKWNCLNAQALLQNQNIKLLEPHQEVLFQKNEFSGYQNFIANNFSGIYFTDEENAEIDVVYQNMLDCTQETYCAAFYALSQSLISKRPFGLFHRKNLEMRTKEVKRSFGNKKTWDTPIKTLFKKFAKEINNAIFVNEKKYKVFNYDAMLVPGNYDLVYIDPPYFSGKQGSTDYLGFYHFLEGLANYSTWGSRINYGSKNLGFNKEYGNSWTNKKEIFNNFNNLFDKYKDSTIIVSYRSDGVPSPEELVALVKMRKKNVKLYYLANTKYYLAKNNDAKEILIIGS